MRGAATLATIFHKILLLLFLLLFQNGWQVWQQTGSPRRIRLSASHTRRQMVDNLPGIVMLKSIPWDGPPDHTLEFGSGGGKVWQF